MRCHSGIIREKEFEKTGLVPVPEIPQRLAALGCVALDAECGFEHAHALPSSFRSASRS